MALGLDPTSAIAALPDHLIADMRRLDMVKWDRYTYSDEPERHVAVFGWIDRDDGRADFVLLRDREEGTEVYTSSAYWSPRLVPTMEGRTAVVPDPGHVSCCRVESAAPAGELPNCIRLDGDPVSGPRKERFASRGVAIDQLAPDQCLFCDSRQCDTRIVAEGYDEVACRLHARDLEHHADARPLGRKKHISSTGALCRGDVDV